MDMEGRTTADERAGASLRRRFGCRTDERAPFLLDVALMLLAEIRAPVRAQGRAQVWARPEVGRNI